jgi:hypothetical protein
LLQVRRTFELENGDLGLFPNCRLASEARRGGEWRRASANAICGFGGYNAVCVPCRNGAEPGSRHARRHASVDELLKIPGMTRVWAARIVRFRPYRTKQELLERGIVTSQVYDRIKDYVIAHREAQ